MRIKLLLFLPLLFMVLGCAQLMDNHKMLSAKNAPRVNPRPPVSPADKLEQEAASESDAEALQDDILAQLDVQSQQFNARLRTFLDAAGEKGVSVSTRPTKRGDQGEVEEISIDFFDADVMDVIRLFMEVLDENYILHPGVGGKLTLHLKDEFRRDQLMDLLLGVLRINGVAMVHNPEGVWEFMPLANAPRTLTGDQIILPEDETRPNRGQIIQGFRLRFAAASEMIKIIEPHLSQGSLVYANDPQGVLLICDYPHSLSKAEKLIEMFDISVFADLNIQVYPLKFVLANDLAEELEKIAEATGLLNITGRESVSFLPLERVNLLCVLAKDEQTLGFVDAWVRELDREQPLVVQEEQDESIFVYYVQNGAAMEIITALQGVFAEQKSQVARDKEQGQDLPIGQQLREAENPAEEAKVDDKERKSTPGVVSGKLSGPVTFVVDETTNSILTKCTGTDYKKVEQVIKKLDIYPKQVLIEVIIAEVQLDDTTKLGVEWKYLLNLAGDATGSVSVDSGLGVISSGATNIASGLAVGVGDSRLLGALKAFADDNRVQILSSPHILASNHKEAKINVGEEVPVVTSEYRTTEAASTATTVDTTIQYRDTGIILTVTPHINERGLVRLELSQEVSEISSKTVEGISSSVFSNREATSTVVVNDGQTVIIGGLIKQTQNNLASGVPGVNRVPLLKYLFGYEERGYHSTELLIFITPHVVESREDNELFSRNFISRLNEIKESMR